MSKLIAICGKICSGKSFYANNILANENAVILSVDELTFFVSNNLQGENYNRLAENVKEYLKTKAVELIKKGISVIFDWGFWTRESRRSLTEFCKLKDIDIEWHFVDISDEDWEINIEERNNKILSGIKDYNFYIDDGLKDKCLFLWEKPESNEINVLYKFNRK